MKHSTGYALVIAAQLAVVGTLAVQNDNWSVFVETVTGGAKMPTPVVQQDMQTVSKLDIETALLIAIGETEPYAPGNVSYLAEPAEPDEMVSVATFDHESYYCLAQNIYFEARNQSPRGKTAVGLATMNRVKSDDFPNTICGVTKQGPLDGSKISKWRCQFTWYCDGKPDVPAANGNYVEIRAWERSQVIAEKILMNEVDDFTNGSTYFHTTDTTPNWRKVFAFTGTFGDHHFYNHEL